MKTPKAASNKMKQHQCFKRNFKDGNEVLERFTQIAYNQVFCDVMESTEFSSKPSNDSILWASNRIKAHIDSRRGPEIVLLLRSSIHVQPVWKPKTHGDPRVAPPLPRVRQAMLRLVQHSSGASEALA